MTTPDPSTPATTTPTDPSPSGSAPADAPPPAVPTDVASAGPAAPSDAAPADAAPADVAPADAAPADPALAGSAPADAAPPAVPTDVTLAEAAAPSDATPSDAALADAAAADVAPADAPSAEAAPADAASAAATPADAVPALPAPRGAEADPRLLIARGEDAAAAAPQEGTEKPAPSGAESAPAPELALSAPAPAAPVQVGAQAAVPAPAPHAYGAPQPPMPQQPYPYATPAGGQGGAVWAVPPEYAPKVRKARPWLRTVARWTAAVAVTAVVGAVTTALVVRPARTDVPGLATPSDGRWDFPALTLPTLPPGNGNGNADGQHVHRVDLRQLLLPAPTGATADASLPGTHGWFPAASLYGLFSLPQPVKQTLQDSGLRHVAAGGWSMPDGTRTQIYLQQFRSLSTASDVDVVESVSGYLAAAPDAGTAAGIDLAGISQSTIHASPASGSRPAVTYVYLQAGDTEVLVVMSNPKSVPAVDFEQVVELQNRLLTAGA